MSRLASQKWSRNYNDNAALAVILTSHDANCADIEICLFWCVCLTHIWLIRGCRPWFCTAFIITTCCSGFYVEMEKCWMLLMRLWPLTLCLLPICHHGQTDNTWIMHYWILLVLVNSLLSLQALKKSICIYTHFHCFCILRNYIVKEQTTI